MCVSTYTNCTGTHTHTDHSSAPANTPLSRTLHSVSGNHWMRIVNVLLHQTNKFVKSLHAHTHANTVFAAWIRRLWCEKKKEGIIIIKARSHTATRRRGLLIAEINGIASTYLASIHIVPFQLVYGWGTARTAEQWNLCSLCLYRKSDLFISRNNFLLLLLCGMFYYFIFLLVVVVAVRCYDL